MTTQVPFFRPSLGEQEIEEVVATLRSGWLTTGPDEVISAVKSICARYASPGLVRRRTIPAQPEADCHDTVSSNQGITVS
jgi:hypothetical protein